MSKRVFNGEEDTTRGVKRLHLTEKNDAEQQKQDEKGPFYCEPFLRVCRTQKQFQDTGVDVKGLTEYKDEKKCEEACRLPEVMDRFLLDMIGDTQVFNALPHAQPHKIKSEDYQANSKIDDAIVVLEALTRTHKTYLVTTQRILHYHTSLIVNTVFDQIRLVYEFVVAPQQVKVWSLWRLVRVLFWWYEYFDFWYQDRIVNIQDILKALRQQHASAKDWIIHYLEYLAERGSSGEGDESGIKLGAWFNQNFPVIDYDTVQTDPHILNAIKGLFTPWYFHNFQLWIKSLDVSETNALDYLHSLQDRLAFFDYAYIRKIRWLPESIIRMIMVYAVSQPHLPFCFAALNSISDARNIRWKEWNPNPFSEIQQNIQPPRKLGALSTSDFLSLPPKFRRLSFNEWIHLQRMFSLQELFPELSVPRKAGFVSSSRNQGIISIKF